MTQYKTSNVVVRGYITKMILNTVIQQSFLNINTGK